MGQTASSCFKVGLAMPSRHSALMIAAPMSPRAIRHLQLSDATQEGTICQTLWHAAARRSLMAVMASVAVVLFHLQGPAECTVDVSCEQTLQTHLIYHSKAACKQTCGQQDGSGACAAAQEAEADNSPDKDAAFCCLLGTASEPGASYDVHGSGPPLPGCEADRWV
jgi:hypothetical protein